MKIAPPPQVEEDKEHSPTLHTLLALLLLAGAVLLTYWCGGVDSLR